MSESVQIDDRTPTTDAGGARQHAPADVAPELYDAVTLTTARYQR
ncbi:hypothetical protein [Halobellus rubicundus]|uniref:Uncharacterized protein n=1 Tax=Halobellus rubicundus TaxID=2996466 RepID=A0ABD5M7R7_9EURY